MELYAESIANRGLSAVAQAESLKFKLAEGAGRSGGVPARLTVILLWE